jgi:hypothetical protein
MRMVAIAIAGSISGIVTNPKDLPIAYAIQEGDTVTSSLVDTTSGYFMLGFLNEGSYMVSVVDTFDLEFNQDNVTVIAGDNNNLGEITLK